MPDKPDIHDKIPQAAPLLDKLLDNPLHAWITAGATLIGLIVIVQVFRLIILKQLEALAKRTSAHWDDVIVGILKRLKLWLLFPALIYFSLQALAHSDPLDHLVRFLAVIGGGIQLLLMAGTIVDASLTALASRSHADNGEPDPTIASSLGVARAISMGAIGVVVVLLALENLGVQITPLLTGLGIGGIAVALAVQSILGDLFGSLIIILDKPFVVGDLITVGDKTGTVERIGIKTTRVRAQTGEQLVFANTFLLTTPVQNFKRMRERRVAFIVQLVYDTPPDKLTKVPAIVKAAVEKQQNLRFDRCHLRGFGANGLEFESVYFVLSADYTEYMDAQQAINLDILRGLLLENMQIAPNGQPFSRPAPAQGTPPTSGPVTLGPKVAVSDTNGRQPGQPSAPSR